MEKLVSNSTSLICLERINRLDLLGSCVKELYIPTGVYVETNISLPFIQQKKVTNASVVSSLRIHLGLGESEAIALACELKIPVMLDDKKARSIARNMDVPVVGTLGLLVHAKEIGVIQQIKPIINDLQSVGFHIADKLRNKILALANE